jgi:exopolyphosphatase/guanosine-5'-triphosphate,3'-diphosphate pyrophosphatase
MPTFAAVDIGSNSVRLKIARLQHGRLRELHEDREVTRLGEGVFRSGFLTPESMAETVKVLRRFHRTTQQVVTDSVRVVATSALRDARNSQAFLEWVRSATGWKVEIISGVEEARLIHLGLVSGSRIDAAPTLMIDLGGGSCELTISQAGHIRGAVSLPLGAVRLTDEFLSHDPVRKGELKRLRGFVAREVGRITARIAAARIRNVVATSGTAAALAAVATHFAPRAQPAENGRVARRDDAHRQTSGATAGGGTAQDRGHRSTPRRNHRGRRVGVSRIARPPSPESISLFATGAARRHSGADGRRL